MNAPAAPAVSASAKPAALPAFPTYERRLSLGELLDNIASEGHVEPTVCDKLKAEWRLKKSEKQPANGKATIFIINTGMLYYKLTPRR